MGNYHGEINYANGNRYVGELKDGKRNGNGTYYCANGDEFAGEWKDGHRIQGSEIFFMGHHYVGNYQDDLFHGDGAFYIVHRSRAEHWRDGHPESLTEGMPPTYPPTPPSTKIMPFITHYYDGNWAKGKPHGKGTFYWGYGEEGELDYTGQDRWQGHLEGEWIEGVLVGGDSEILEAEDILLVNSMCKEKTLLMRGNLSDE